MKTFVLILAILLISLSSFANDDNDQLVSEETLKSMVAANPDNVALRNALGGFYSNAKQYDKAEKEFKKIIELAPDFAPVYVNYGIMEEERGDFRKGIDYLTKGISLNKGSGELTNDNLAMAHIRLGHCYGWLKQYDDAIREYETACQLNPSFTLIQTHNSLGSLYLSKALNTKDALLIGKGRAHYEKVLEKSPNDKQALQGLKYVEATAKKLGEEGRVTVKQSGNTLIVFPEKYEKQAENLKAALDKK